MTTKKVQGEGDYESARKYNEATREYAQSGRVDEAARAAAPRDAAEQRELKQAEETGEQRAKDEDPAVKRPRRAKKAKRATGA
jgi:hypothetical protein